MMDRSSTLTSPPDYGTEAFYASLLVELAAGAREHRFRVAPNPCVGAAILGSGVELGRGYHERWGGAHAEVRALEAASALANGPSPDTAVITLEPCSTRGKTPPCVEALLRAGIRLVVVGATDPDPRHRGAGLRALEEAGIEVLLVPNAAPLHEVAPYFFDWVSPDRLRRGLPWVIAKWAQTRTGQLSPPEDIGEGRWISSPPAREEVQLLRGEVDAVLTGIGTVRADDPRLSVRLPGDVTHPPLRVVVDPSLSILPSAKLFHSAGDGVQEAGGAVHIICVHGMAPARHRAFLAEGVKVHGARPGDDGRPALLEVQRILWDLGVRRMLLEAGPTLLEAYFDEKLIDQVAVYTGMINGGRGPSVAKYLDQRGFHGTRLGEVGADARMEAFVRHPGSTHPR